MRFPVPDLPENAIRIYTFFYCIIIQSECQEESSGKCLLFRGIWINILLIRRILLSRMTRIFKMLAFSPEI